VRSPVIVAFPCLRLVGSWSDSVYTVSHGFAAAFLDAFGS